MSNQLRITGMASGLDVDTMVKQLMTAEKTKVDKLSQDRQIVQWKQDLYRNLIGELNTFKSTYFDVLKPDNYMLSSRNYSSFDISTTTSTGGTTSALTATAGSGAAAGLYKVRVQNLAQKASFEGSNLNNSKEAISKIGFPVVIGDTNNKLTIDSKEVVITNKTYNSVSDLASEINSKMAAIDIGDNKKLSDSVQAIAKDDKIIFERKITIDSTNNSFTLTSDGNTYNVQLTDGSYTMESIASQINSKLSALTDGSGNKFPQNKKVASLDGINLILVDENGTQTAGSVTDSINILDIPVTSTSPGTSNIVSLPSSSPNLLQYDKKIFAGVNDKLTVKAGGTIRTLDLAVELSSVDLNDSNAIASKLGSKLSDLNISVGVSQNGKLLFTSNSTQQVTISGNATGMLGLSSTFDVNQTTNDKMSNLVQGVVEFKVNGVNFKYDFSTDYDNGTTIGARNKTISDILSDISTKANVDFSYSQLTRKFTLSSKSTGSDQIIKDTQYVSGNDFLNIVLGKSKITDANGDQFNADGSATTGVILKGEDATVYIKPPSISSDDSNLGIQLIRSTNNFSLDGINYSLNSKTDDYLNLNLTSNPQKTFDKIKGFVDKYNEIIDKINSKLFEKKQYSYKPLTDEQKKEMKEEDIKSWEEKAKQGLLSNDSTLSNALYRMRNSFYDSVKTSYDSSSSIGISLSDIGIKTSSDVGERGKLTIDEATLKAAIQNNGDKVMQLFTKTSISVPSYNPNANSADKDKRYKELGIFQRISDILQDNLRTLRDNSGKKGMLLEKAGIKGDLSEYKNLLTDDILRRDKIINEMTSKLADKENRYYMQFSKLESAMQKLNSQSSWLSQQLGSMNG